MSYAANAQRLEAASERLIDLVAQMTNAAETGRDSVEYACRMKVLARQAALADQDFWEALSQVHYDNLDIAGETTCESAPDFAEFSDRIARDRSVAPFEGGGVSKSYRQPVDLRGNKPVDLAPFYQQAAE